MSNTNRLKKTIIALTTIFICFSNLATIDAQEERVVPEKCTAIYVGKDVSLEGTMIIARSNDQMTGVNNRIYTVVERETGENRKIVDTGKNQNNFSVSIPDETYKYNTLLNASGLEEGPYYGTCINECGVSVLATVTTEVSKEYALIDPLKKQGEGIRESIIAAIVACQAKDAYEGVAVLASYIDEYGSSEYSTVLISDQDEAWIFEIYGGSSYCAKRLPSDKVCVFGNQIMMEYVDFNQLFDYVVSDNLKDNLDKMSNIYKDGDSYHISKTISGNKRYMDSNMRTWIGQYRLAPSKTSNEYQSNYFYDFLFTPDFKVSVLDVMELFGDRFEDTIYEDKIDSNVRPIGTVRQSDVSIVQTFDYLPLETCQLLWLCMGNAEHCVFVPSFSGITETYEKYRIDNEYLNTANDSFYYVARRNAALAETDRLHLSSGLKDFNKKQEKILLVQILKKLNTIQEKYQASKEEGREYVTEFAKEMAETEYDYILDIFEQLSYVVMYNSNERRIKMTFKYVNNDEKITDEYQKEVKEEENIEEIKEYPGDYLFCTIITIIFISITIFFYLKHQKEEELKRIETANKKKKKTKSAKKTSSKSSKVEDK